MTADNVISSTTHRLQILTYRSSLTTEEVLEDGSSLVAANPLLELSSMLIWHGWSKRSTCICQVLAPMYLVLVWRRRPFTIYIR